MTNRPGKIGTRDEQAVVNYIRTAGFGGAERCRTKGSSGDTGDLTGTPGVCWQIKGGKYADATDEVVAAWLNAVEAQRMASGAVIGCLVLKRPNISTARAGQWWVVITADTLAELWVSNVTTAASQLNVELDTMPLRMRLADWCTILRAAGYGDPL